MDSPTHEGTNRIENRDRLYKVWQQVVRQERQRRRRLWWTWTAIALCAALALFTLIAG